RTAPSSLSTLSLHDALPISNYSKGAALVPESVPAAMQQQVRDDGLTWAYSELVLANHDRVKGLVFGGPVHVGARTLELYYLFPRSEEHTSELQSPDHLVCRL